MFAPPASPFSRRRASATRAKSAGIAGIRLWNRVAPPGRHTTRALGSGAQHGEELVRAARVHHAIALRPAPAGGADGVVQVPKLGHRVRVDRAGHLAAVATRDAEQVGAEVEAAGRAVALHRDALRAGQLDQLLPAGGDLRPLQDLAAGRVPPDPAERVREGAADALGLRRFVQLEALVHRADHHVELLQHRVGQVEPAVLQDVHLAPAQDADAGHALLHGRDLVPLLLQAV